MKTFICFCLLLSGSVWADQQANSLLQIPFNYHKHQILLQAGVAGEGPFTFLLDTGVTPSAIDIELARRLGLPLDQNNAIPASGAGSETVYIYPTRIEALRIAGRQFGNIDAVAFPAAGLSGKLGQTLHGILGDSFLQGKTVTIDYQRHLLLLGGPPPSAGPNVYAFPLVTAPDDIMPMLELVLNGATLRLSMDTGSSFGLELFASGQSLAETGRLTADWNAVSATSCSSNANQRFTRAMLSLLKPVL